MADLKGEARARYVASLFARISHRYDLLNTVMTGGLHHRWRRLAALRASEGLDGPALDVATGTGDFAFALARRPGIGPVVGVDFVPEMVSLATKKGEHRQTTRQVIFLQGDALALPFPDDTFACATSSFGLRNLTDAPSALAEMTRVVRPGGRVVVLEIIPIERNGPLPMLVRFYFRRLVPILGGVLTGDWQAYTYLPQSVETFHRAGDLTQMMEMAGLQEVRHSKLGMGSIAILTGEKPGTHGKDAPEPSSA